MKKSLCLLFAILCVAACQVEELSPEIQPENNVLYSSMESIDATRTSMDEYNNVLWSENDQLVAFMKTTLGIRYQVKEQYVGTTTGGFSKVQDAGSGDDLESGQEIDHNVVLYPYSDQVWCMKYDSSIPAKSYKLNVVLPETQIYAENSFANGSFPMVAVSTNNQLTFKNICGGVKLQFKGVDKIKSIQLEGLGGEAISGKSSVVAYSDGTTPAITMASTASKSVTLDCGDGVQLNESTPTTFIIAVPPVTFASGMKIIVTDTDGLSKTLTNTASNTVKRSSLLNFPVITYKQNGVLEFPEGAMTSYEVPAEGGTIEIPVVTNLDYEVVIPETAAEWITLGQTKALRNEVIILDIAENSGAEERSADVLVTDGSETLMAVTIVQEAKAFSEIWYTSSDGKVVSPDPAATFGASIISNTYENGKGVIKFDGAITHIGYEAFEYRSRLTSIVIPNSVTSIEDRAFKSCNSLENITIPSSVGSVGDEAFYFCTKLKDVTVEGYVSDWGDEIFTGCYELEKFNGPMATSDGRCIVTNGVLVAAAVAGLQEYTIPDIVTSIRGYVFSYTSLTYITIPDSVTSIGNNAFRNCYDLTSITIPDSVTSIGDNAFYHCPSLTDITIPNSVTSIGDYAFSDCSSLTDITIPNSVTSIGDGIFSSCSSLTTINIPDSITQIGVDAFSYCTSLSSITLPDSVTSIRSGAFKDCSSLRSVVIPNNVTSIEDYTFYYCTSLTSVTIPNSVTFIGHGAFGYCSSLISITIPDSVTSIDSRAFDSCELLMSIYLASPYPPVIYDGEIYLYNSDRLTIYVPEEYIERYKSDPNWQDFNILMDYSRIIDNQQIWYASGQMIDIDASDFGGANVVSHHYENGIGIITFDADVTRIGSYAFYECSSLTNIIIPSSVASIGDYAFSYCYDLTSITIPDRVTSIESGAFDGCSSLISINIPDSVTSIGNSAFSWCSSLRSVIFPNTITSIESSLLFGCTSLRRIKIPDSVTSIKTSAFACSSIYDITIPNSVTSIGSDAFGDCHALHSITIPASVTLIGEEAFRSCDYLEVYVENPVPFDIGSEVFRETNVDIYVPMGSEDAYKSDPRWEEYKEMICGY